MKEEKKEVEVTTNVTWDAYYMEGDLDAFIQKMCNIKLSFPEYSRFQIASNAGYEEGEISSFEVYGIRLETDEEFDKRIEMQKKAREVAKKAAITRKANDLKKEKELYLKLKQKYEP